jgi:hypothetical protein
MDKSFIGLIVALVIILYFSGLNSGSFESFTTGVTEFNDPLIYSKACKSMVKQKSQVSELERIYQCDQTNPRDLLLSSRDGVNKKMACKNLLDKQLMLGTEQPSWCSRVEQVERDSIVNVKPAPGPAPTPAATLASLEGPEYMQTQYTSNFGSLLPNESSSNSFVLFSNMADPVNNLKYANA